MAGNEAKRQGQFSRLAAAAVLRKTLPDKALRVLAFIGVYADKYGCAFPSVETIARGLGITERQVQRHLRRLEAEGLIETQRTRRPTKGGWGRNRYWLKYPAVTVEVEVTPDVTSEQIGEVTPEGRRGDIRGPGEVTQLMSDNSAQWRISPMANQPNGGAGPFASQCNTEKGKEDPESAIWKRRAKLATKALLAEKNRALHDAIARECENFRNGRTTTWPPPGFPELAGS